MLQQCRMRELVNDVLAATPFIDMHTHLFAPEFGGLGLWGIDELLTYHYLEAELFRFSSIHPHTYQAMDKSAQADLIWKVLFRANTPVSEATRGVMAVLHAFGLDPDTDSLRSIRDFFAAQDLGAHITHVFELAGIDRVVMTNDPLNETEAALWGEIPQRDQRFEAALRLDRIVNDWAENFELLSVQGFRVERECGGWTTFEVRRFLDGWCERMHPRYMAVSLPDDFTYPDAEARTKLLTEAVLPACHEHGIPLALMMGVRRRVNPLIQLAGDGSGRSDLSALETLCRDFPDNRFLVTVLSRENQHELCVYARKFSNLMPFGCWWFLNNPSIVEEITRERIEMLGMSFIPQHSDARILEQVIYKWRNTRRTVAPLLTRTYELLAEDGGRVHRGNIESDVRRLFRGNFESFTKPRASAPS